MSELEQPKHTAIDNPIDADLVDEFFAAGEREEWIGAVKQEILDIISSEDPLIKKIEDLAHMVIKERADLVRMIGKLQAPSDWE